MTTGTKIARYIRRFSASLILLVILSCESFKEDEIQPEDLVTFNQTDYYILPGSSVVIDLSSIVKQSFITADLSISQDPSRGELSQLDTLLLKYKPGADFTEGKDEFILSASTNGKILETDTVTIIMVQNEGDLPCTFYAIEDEAHVRPGSSTSISFLENDHLCGTGSVQVSIHSNPQFGEANLVGDTIIVYTPGSAFTGQDELVYKLSASSGETYGVITISKQKFQILEVPHSVGLMFFVDENIGFLAGDEIYKTIDGAETWNKLPRPPFDPYGICHFTDIFFLDVNSGFAAYSSCVDGVSTAGLLSTTDGGISWKKLNIDQSINSVFFTSTTTGFVAAHIVTQDEKVISKVFKTEDGGSTWRETFTSPDNASDHYFLKQFQFINSSTGYGLQNESNSIDGNRSYKSNLFKTLDGGESWELLTSNNSIGSIAVIPENIICATTSLGNSVVDPGSIARSTDGVTWKSAANFSYNSWHLDFSPSGNFGLTVGLSDPNVDLFDTLTHIISIHKSIDKGASWEEEIHEPLYGWPAAIATPSNNVAYIYSQWGINSKIIKYSLE